LPFRYSWCLGNSVLLDGYGTSRLIPAESTGADMIHVHNRLLNLNGPGMVWERMQNKGRLFGVSPWDATVRAVL
jgi:hypothetical protein